MVIITLKSRRRSHGWLEIDLAVAVTILVIVMLPLAYSINSEAKLQRGLYYRSVAMEIVDGEMEVLAGGEWRAFQPGTHDYTVKAAAAKNLPVGKFVLTIADKRIRLEWLPERTGKGGSVAREAAIP